MTLECDTVKKSRSAIYSSQAKWYQTISDKAKRYNFPHIIHYSSWKVNSNPTCINSVSSNFLKFFFAKTSQIINYEIYMLIYLPGVTKTGLANIL